MANVTSDSYLIVIEKTAKSLSAFSPDLPGCVATGADHAEVEAHMGRGTRSSSAAGKASGGGGLKVASRMPPLGPIQF